ncbi:MAG TPA: CAP domain-containing protein, partial [Chitinophagaceae bacterium]|nr:CAP domain-containing protein [Chitinophagaceae bacterium]
MKRITFYILLVFLFSYSCQKRSDIQPGKNDDPAVDSTVNRTLLLQLVNDVRGKGCNCGATAMPPVAAVTWNNRLEAAARAHAEDMSKNNYFSHTGLNGSTPGDRITAAGYEWQGYGENIAKGYPSEQAVVDAWIKSEGHCKNIMNGNFKEMGVAMT